MRGSDLNVPRWVALVVAPLMALSASTPVAAQQSDSLAATEPPALEWTMVQLQPGQPSEGLFVSDVEVLGGGFVLVGGISLPDQRTALAWKSSDGSTWQPIAVPGSKGVVIGGIVAALLIGAVAGLYPAMRAARVSPTEALRTL